MIIMMEAMKKYLKKLFQRLQRNISMNKNREIKKGNKKIQKIQELM